jgi:N-acyl-D-aspartate/D-glutamate deacylase
MLSGWLFLLSFTITNQPVSWPELIRDLPAGGKRLIQRAHGYRHTLLSGVEVLRDDRSTGALPGAVVRGGQAAPR